MSDEEETQLDETSSKSSVIKIGGVELKTATAREFRLRLLLWGRYGAGKTTLASTAPGPILYLGFDHDGDAPLLRSKDLFILDYSNAPASVVYGFRSSAGATIQELSRFLSIRMKEGNPIATIIIDSMTSFARMALEHGVVGLKGQTLEDPGFKGFGRKNVWVNYSILALLRLAAIHNTHLIVICHEDKPDRNDEGAIIEYPIMLGSSLAYQVPVSINEVWYIEQGATGQHTIRFKPDALHKHVKTRMFSKETRVFAWNYDPETGNGVTLAKIFEAWQANNFAKIAI